MHTEPKAITKLDIVSILRFQQRAYRPYLQGNRGPHPDSAFIFV